MQVEAEARGPGVAIVTLLAEVEVEVTGIVNAVVDRGRRQGDGCSENDIST